MSTLFDACLGVARFCLPAHNGIATGGSATTVADTKYTQVDTYFAGGTIFVITGNNAGKYARVTTYASGTFTFDTMTLLNAAGNQYAAFPARNGKIGAWLPDMINAINAAIAETGNGITEDQTLTTVAGQEEYTLPTGVGSIKRVHISSNTAAPYDWVELRRWREVSGKLRFVTGWAPPLDGYTLRIGYTYDYDPLIASDDNLHVDVNWIIYKASAWLLKNQASMGTLDKAVQDRIAEAEAKAAAFAKPARRDPVIKLAGW